MFAHSGVPSSVRIHSALARRHCRRRTRCASSATYLRYRPADAALAEAAYVKFWGYTLKAIYLSEEGGALKLVSGDRPVPTPASEQLLIRVAAAGVTPTELLWYPTTHTQQGGVRDQAIPGHEFSGVVAAVGQDVHRFAVGDEIYGMNDWFADGATAEFCLAVSSGIARKPSKLSHAEAAAVPIAALTAWQGPVLTWKAEGR
jgi:NADPH:quinone reductase-like Zn-dependent oxidoreductase